MRIGIFTETWKPIINGVVNSIIGFKKGLEELGHEVHVFCPTYKNYKDDPKDKNIIHMKSLPLPGKTGYHFVFPVEKRVKEIAKAMDLIHVQHPFIMGDRAADTAKEFNIPFVFTNHTQYEQYAHYIPISKEIVTRSIEWYIKRFTNRVDLIVTPGAGMVRILKSYGVTTPIDIVPNGIDVARFEKKVSESEIEKLQKKYNLDPNKKVLIFTGRIAEEKNLTFLLKVFAKLTSCHREETNSRRGDLNYKNKIASDIPRNDDLKLLLVGGGPQIEIFRNLIKELKLESKAIITDYVPYQEMQNYLALAYLYVTASKSEVHPLTILEGMAAGLPMVIVKAPGTGDIVTNNVDGLVASDNINNFVSKIEMILNDHVLYKKLAYGAKKTVQQYSFLATSKTMLISYDKAIKIHQSKFK